MWSRVFLPGRDAASPAALAEHLHASGRPVEPHFKGDDLGWTEGDLRLPGGPGVLLARFLTVEDNLRADLNAYAAELETMDYSPANVPLMATVIAAGQMITVRRPVAQADESAIDDVCELSCRFLAAAGGGVYQVDGRGWFGPAGELLLQEY